MNGGLVPHSRGFTIVETMIVLAVSMALFLSAVLMINGRQHATAFNQSVGDIKNVMQQITNEVGSGYYPNNGNIKCVDNSGTPVLSTVATEQGMNIGCVFLGKVIQFGLPGGDEGYNVYTLAGASSAFTGSTVVLAKSRVIAPENGGEANTGSGFPLNQYDAKLLQYGLKVSPTYADPTLGKVTAIGFITNLSSIGAGVGLQRTDVVALTDPDVRLGDNAVAGAKRIDDSIRLVQTDHPDHINPTKGITMCFNSGGTNQSALITIGGSGRQGNVSSQIFGKANCL